MKHINQIIKDVLPVIIGILIALVINNWNEDRKDKEYLNQISNSINEELKESFLDIKENIPKQQRLIDSLKANLTNEKATILDIVNMAEGIYAPRIQNNSWKALANSRIELIEFEKLSALSELDDSKSNLQYKLKKIMDFLYENIKNTSEEKKEVLMLMIIEIVGSEKYLNTEIEQLIQE